LSIIKETLEEMLLKQYGWHMLVKNVPYEFGHNGLAAFPNSKIWSYSSS
jgi:hypothetical protein